MLSGVLLHLSGFPGSSTLRQSISLILDAISSLDKNENKNLFEILLFFILSIAGVFLLLESRSFNKDQIIIRQIPRAISILIGSIIGFVSGLVGIGGGIFLSPILFLLRAGYPKHITSAASLFILINSISGILGQLTKENILIELSNYVSLFICVFIGGLLGNYLNLKIFTSRNLAIITSLLVIFVSIRMGLKIFF